MLDLDQIAENEVEEMFGAMRGRARHPVRAAHRRRAARREHQRAGWGTPGWQASQSSLSFDSSGYPEEEEYYEEDQFSDEGYEDDYEDEFGTVLEAEEEYGTVLQAEDEYGRRHPVRRAVRRGHHPIRRAIRRRRHRRAHAMQPDLDAARVPMAPPEFMDPGFSEVSFDEMEEFGAPYSPARSHGARTGPSSFGNVSVPAPAQHSSFKESLGVGVGVGLGFFGVAVAMGLLFGGRR